MASPTDPVIDVDFETLPRITEELQSIDKRDSEPYRAKLAGIGRLLAGLDRGVITKIDVDELRDQYGHLLYFAIRGGHRVPYDIDRLDHLQSHFKNPAILKLRQIRRYLMASDRKTLARLEENQARERQIDFRSLNLDALIRNGLEEMQSIQTMAALARTVSRKLDFLTRALQVPAEIGGELRLLKRFLADRYHLRYKDASAWLARSAFRGNATVARKLMDHGLAQLQQKSEQIFEEMEKLSGIPFDRDIDGLEIGFTWYSLGTPLRRGEEFVRIFENEERIEQQIKRLTFFMVRAAWDADRFRELIEANQPNVRNRQEHTTALARIYFEIEDKIAESSPAEGAVQTAIDADLAHGRLSEKEAREAREWVAHNKAALKQLSLEVFAVLREVRATSPEVALPEQIETLLTAEGEGAATVNKAGLPKIGIMDLNNDFNALTPKLSNPDGEVLAELIALRGRALARNEQMGHVDFQRQIRDACVGFEDFEERLLEYDKLEARIDQMIGDLEAHIIDVYREITYSEVAGEVLDETFEIVVDHMLRALRALDYDAVAASRYRELFDKALLLDDDNALLQMDRLLHEVHTIPRQNQLLPALAEWEGTLPRSEIEEKQDFVLTNEFELQKLVDEVRGELRERIGRTHIKPRRLRFEVFSMADSYAGNLRGLLHALLRMAPSVASNSEGERLIANIQAVEAQVIEAQRITKPGGDAEQKLAELERGKLLPDQVLSDLHEDLRENFVDLDALLEETNEGLARVRALQNRFGGEHDTAYLSTKINIHDLEQLKKTYQFVDNITLSDVKRFGVIYKLKTQLMDELYKKALVDHEEIPPAIGKLIDKKAFRGYSEKRVVPLPIKRAILEHMPDMLEFEIELMIRTLNLVSAEGIRTKSIYVGLLRILSMAKGASLDRKRALRRIWVKFRNKINGYEPKNFQANFTNNARALMIDVKETVGSAFDGL